MNKMVFKNQIKNNKYYSYKYLGNFSGKLLYEEKFNSVLYEQDQQKAKNRQQIIDRVQEKTIKKDILYEKIFNLEPFKQITYTVESNYHDKSLTVLGSDDSSISVNWKYDIINWHVNKNTLVFREVDRSTNEQYDRTINISNGKVEGSRKVMLEERIEKFVNKKIDPEIMGNTDSPKKSTLGSSCSVLSLINSRTFANSPTILSGHSTLKHLTELKSVAGSMPKPGAGFRRIWACARGIVIELNNRGEVVCTAVNGITTNNLDLKNIIINSGLLDTRIEGAHAFTFEFYGWRKRRNTMGGINDPEWVSADDKYKIYKNFFDRGFYSVI
jgi:hypothetical protein